MTSLPIDSIQVSANDIVVDAELLAKCLDLSVDSLRKAMSAGDVRTLVENGEGESGGNGYGAAYRQSLLASIRVYRQYLEQKKEGPR